jgi:hypothetical protein
MEQIWQDTMLRAVVGLLVANVLARLATALSCGASPFKPMLAWLSAELVPWLLRALVEEIVLLSLPPDWADLQPVARGTVCLCLCSALLRHLLQALRDPA